MSHEYEFAWKLGEYFLTIAKHMRSRGGSEVAGALGAETVSQLLCGYGFALFGWRSRGGGEALDAFPGLAVSRSYCDVLVCLSCIQGERQDRRRLRSYNNELAVLSMVVPS